MYVCMYYLSKGPKRISGSIGDQLWILYVCFSRYEMNVTFNVVIGRKGSRFKRPIGPNTIISR